MAKRKVWKSWGIFSKADRLVDMASTRKVARMVARGRMGAHSVHRIIITRTK